MQILAWILAQTEKKGARPKGRKLLLLYPIVIVDGICILIEVEIIVTKFLAVKHFGPGINLHCSRIKKLEMQWQSCEI